jgi:predicted RND superfamily exporter protein
MGWLRIPLSYTTALTTSIVLGTSVEDVLYFVLFYRQQAARLGHEEAMALTGQKAGIATVQTTLIIVIGLAVLLISSITPITQSGILTGLSLSFGTLVTLLVVPPLIARFPLPAAGSTRGGGS